MLRTTEGLAEAFEQFPELDSAEVVEPADQVLIGGLHENPPGGPGGLGRHEMNPAPDRLRGRVGLQIHPPRSPAPGQVAEMAGTRMVGKIE